jgi:chemotaxis protein histidine kinase CheA
MPRFSKAVNAVLVDTGTFDCGLKAGELRETVAIVVKGLGDYAGVTNLGDRRVALILDVASPSGRG